MASNKNVFCVTNPARMMDALLRVISDSGADIADILIFLPSRRSVRTLERALVDRAGHAVILPRIVALGEGADGSDLDNGDLDVITNTAQVVALAKLLSADAAIGNIATALPVAHDLVRMADYLENEGINISDIDWDGLVDSRYALHFQRKAQILKIISTFMSGRKTVTSERNRGIRAWIDMLDKYSLVVVCGSTASVPATADLMAAVAARKHGRIILSGQIDGRPEDFALNTNPYNAEYKFLTRIGLDADDVIKIDVGPSAIGFMNFAFGNIGGRAKDDDVLSHCHLVECARESIEAAAAIEIATRAVADNKSVLIITPDAAGNERIATVAAMRGLDTDFSGGMSAKMTAPGRAIINQFDYWIENNDSTFDKLYAESEQDLLRVIVRMVDENICDFTPSFDFSDLMYAPLWCALRELSDAVKCANINLSVTDARAFLYDMLSGVTIRRPKNTDAKIVVLGTIESRMQTADVVILTGLNDGMFPARGYENAWLPTHVATQIGLPSPDRKVSLMSLDFINLSCGKDVYWLRSRTAGGVQTTESRFISRVRVAGGNFDENLAAKDILSVIYARDDVPPDGLDYSPPQLDAPDKSDVYVTELELLTHNPYAFYVRHILRLRPMDNYWMPPDARVFGDLVHSVIENCHAGASADDIVSELDKRAHEILKTDGVLFRFWHKRFVEIADFIAQEMQEMAAMPAEIPGATVIAGRRVCARADRVFDGGVIDIKTGAAPTKSQLNDGVMPQLPLEAYMLKSGGFHVHTTEKSRTPIMRFLQLKSGDVRRIEYDSETTQTMIDNTLDKITGLFNQYSNGNAPYEYHETRDKKYQAYDDLARNKD